MLSLWPHLYTVPKCLRDTIGPLKIQSLLRKANFQFDPPEVRVIWFCWLLPPTDFSWRSRVGLFSQFSPIPALATFLFLLPPISVLLELPPLFPVPLKVVLAHSWSLLGVDSVSVAHWLSESHMGFSGSCHTPHRVSTMWKGTFLSAAVRDIPLTGPVPSWRHPLIETLTYCTFPASYFLPVCPFPLLESPSDGTPIYGGLFHKSFLPPLCSASGNSLLSPFLQRCLLSSLQITVCYLLTPPPSFFNFLSSSDSDTIKLNT